MQSFFMWNKILCLALLGAGIAACGGGDEPQDQASRRILANPYNSKVRGNVYHSKWKDLELEFPTRTWRVENGPYALHLVAKDKYSQVIVGSRFRLVGGSLDDAASKTLKRLGMRDYEILAKEPARLQNVDALVITAKGQFLVDYFKDLRVDRKVRLMVARTSRRLYWMAYVSTEQAFPEYLPAVEQLQQSLTILSRPKAEQVGSRREHDARVDVAVGEVAASGTR
jgi:hypothetical protein